MPTGRKQTPRQSTERTTSEHRPVARRGAGAKSAERRRSIVEAAHAVFAERGYQAGSFQEIADRVGMSQTGLLHYFPTKSELLLAVLHRRDEITVDAAPESEGLIQGIVGRARANESLPGVIELYSVLCAESTTEGHPARSYFVGRFAEIRTTYAAELRALQAEGRVRPGVDPERAAASLVGLWDGLQVQWLLEPERIDVATCLRDYLELLLEPS
ncbi:TetR family transcriptional regulator [Promicromonospora sp. NPDC057138]|uniref:TetR family transcriptional regulator n=1 Tax=Promicromonospora sp. NPDC057138 TaxID=3346031 RepID=UPI003637541E